ncbi:hypothetical protein [Parasphingorhabdus sp.]|uniref:hypothetical protein n=1 Tax=Parasphingorhabdus sp. TaxID=2709688 RepID=UPI003D2CE385
MIIRIRHSRYRLWLIAAVALPLSSMPLSARSEGMEIQLCSADGAVRTLTIPLDREEDDDHCAKPCHACQFRKKGSKNR